MDVEDILLVKYLMNKKKQKKKRKYWVHPINRLRITYGEFHILVQQLKRYDDRFFRYFRMSVAVYNELITLVHNVYVPPVSNRKDVLTMEEKLVVCLRYVNFFTISKLYNHYFYKYYLLSTTMLQHVLTVTDF